MKGLELSERYFFDCGLPLIKKHFPDLVGRIAAGLISRGSEVYGYDDELSPDHSWGPRFLLFMNEDDARQHRDEVQALLDRELPTEYAGCRMMTVQGDVSDRNAWVTIPEESCRFNTGFAAAPERDEDWLRIPENCLFEFTAGKVFYEPVPLLTPLREQFSYFPEMVWRKRLSFAWLEMTYSQNIRRTVQRRDRVTTWAFLSWALHCCMRIAHLLNRRYAPIQKWLFRSFSELPQLPDGMREEMEAVLSERDLHAVEPRLLRILDALGRMANESGLIHPQPLRRADKHFKAVPFNFHGFMKAFWDTLSGPLKDMRIEVGPLDLTGCMFVPVGTGPISGIFA